jgi:hypothetical protein
MSTHQTRSWPRSGHRSRRTPSFAEGHWTKTVRTRQGGVSGSEATSKPLRRREQTCHSRQQARPAHTCRQPPRLFDTSSQAGATTTGGNKTDPRKRTTTLPKEAPRSRRHTLHAPPSLTAVSPLPLPPFSSSVPTNLQTRTRQREREKTKTKKRPAQPRRRGWRRAG